MGETDRVGMTWRRGAGPRIVNVAGGDDDARSSRQQRHQQAQQQIMGQVIDRERRLETIHGQGTDRRSAERRIENEDIDFRATDLFLDRRGEGPNTREACEVKL